MKCQNSLFVAAIAILISGDVRARAAVSQSPIPGYVCMDLNITDAQASFAAKAGGAANLARRVKI